MSEGLELERKLLDEAFLPLHTFQRFHEEVDPGAFMWMGYAYAGPDQTPIHLYKHSLYRRYLNLSADGRCWRMEPDGEYVPYGSPVLAIAYATS